MNAQNLEQRIKNIERELEEFKKRGAATKTNRMLHKKWRRSLFRVAISLSSAYVGVGMYLHFLHFPNPWIRATIPVVTIMIFLFIELLLKRLWLKYKNKKAKADGKLIIV